jgi:hypothetical protein
MNTLTFIVEKGGNGHLRLELKTTLPQAPGVFAGKPSGRIEFWNLIPALADLPIGTEIEINWPNLGEKSPATKES